mgnify:CR=1 FL=1|jgi:hypothetical protein
MELKLHTVSRDKVLYEAYAIYSDGTVTVKKDSRINIHLSAGYKPTATIQKLRDDSSVVDGDGVLLKDIPFDSLSTAASFVTGRTANGMIVWKTENGRYVRYALQESASEGEKHG